MKKTAQTLLTAAMFAAALGTAAAQTTASPQKAAAIGETTAPETTITMPTTEPVVLYGPPWVLSSLEEERQKTATSTTTTTTTTTTTSEDPELEKVPLKGKYNLKLQILEKDRMMLVPGLECELFRMEDGEIIEQWTTGEEQYFECRNLRYEFKDRNPETMGSVTYGLRIKNLPEGYSLADPNTTAGNEIGVSGDQLRDFLDGTSLRTTVFLKDASVTATDPVTTTFEDPSTTEPVVLYGPPWVFHQTGDADKNDVLDARDLTLIKRAALVGPDEGKGIDYETYNIADVDHDGVVDAGDIKKFREEQLGFPALKPEEPVVTTGPEDPSLQITSSLETTTETTIMTLYGPPAILG